MNHSSLLLLSLSTGLVTLAIGADLPGTQHRVKVEDLPRPYASESVKNRPEVVKPPAGATLQVPAGFEVSQYARGFKNPRHLATAPNGDILVTESEPGEIRVLRDTDGDGKPDLNEVLVYGLKKPFGVAFHPLGPNPEHLYVANTDGIVRFPYSPGQLKITAPPQKVTDLSGDGQLEGGGHWTRDIVFSADGQQLFASVGSKSNVDDAPVENDRARIFVMQPDGSKKRAFATGIRNPVGIAIHPKTGDLWASVNERDELGDDLVPDYITRVKDGGFYGWPWYYLGANPDPRRAKNPHPELASQVIVPDVLLEAHSASLNMVFYTGTQFPEAYRGDAFAALHGSWNRQAPTGYKVIRVRLENGQPRGGYEDFLTGFVLPNGKVWGRPVGLTVAGDGALLVSEDGNDTIWRVSARR